MKTVKLLILLIAAFFLITPIFASAYIYSNQQYNPYYTRAYIHGPYGPYANSYHGYYPYRSTFYTGGYNAYYGTYGYSYAGDQYFKYAALDYFFRTSPSYRR